MSDTKTDARSEDQYREEKERKEKDKKERYVVIRVNGESKFALKFNTMRYLNLMFPGGSSEHKVGDNETLFLDVITDDPDDVSSQGSAPEDSDLVKTNREHEKKMRETQLEYMQNYQSMTPNAFVGGSYEETENPPRRKDEDVTEEGSSTPRERQVRKEEKEEETKAARR